MPHNQGPSTQFKIEFTKDSNSDSALFISNYTNINFSGLALIEQVYIFCPVWSSWPQKWLKMTVLSLKVKTLKKLMKASALPNLSDKNGYSLRNYSVGVSH